MNKPFFSIIIPVYNVEPYIYNCMESIYNQSFEEDLYEVVVVNDGTPDNSMNIVEKFVEDHSNIKIHNQKNGGVSSARNKGMKLAKGKYFLFVDPDDVILENSLELVYQQLTKSSCELLILNSFISKCESSEGRTITYPFPKKYSVQQFDGLELFKHYNRGSVWGVVYSRTFLSNNNIQFNEELKNGEDALFFSLCLIYTKNILYGDIDFYILNERSGSASRSWDTDRLLVLAKGLNKINEILKSRDLSSAQSAILYSLAFRFISHLIYRFFQQKSIKRSNYTKIKSIILSCGVYPICLDDVPRQRLKIRILNISFDIFASFFYLREIVVRFIYRK